MVSAEIVTEPPGPTAIAPKEENGASHAEGANGVETVENGGKAADDETKAAEDPKVSFKECFRYADGIDKLLMFIGTIFSLGNGTALPLFSLVFGDMLDSLGSGNAALVAKVQEKALLFVYLGIGAGVCSYFEVGFWMIVSERITRRVREHYFKAILRQDIGWFDVNKPQELTTRLASDTTKLSQGIGEKVGNYAHHNATFFAGLIMGFARGWQLTLVILAVTPLLAIAGGIMGKLIASFTTKGQAAYAKAGAVCEETVSSMRTVAMFGGEQRESTRYDNMLGDALMEGNKKGMAAGGGIGFTMLVMFGTYALAFWYGSTLIAADVVNDLTQLPWSGGDVITVFFAVIIGAMGIGQASPNLQFFAGAQGAAASMYAVIDRVPPIDASSSEGITDFQIKGQVEFRDVHFTYPSRPDTKVLNGLSFKCPVGWKLALVGDSGGGKSTVISLLERFYDPHQGQILVDGYDISTLNINAFRKQIGLVSQEPVLFAVSIADNIRYGKPDATDAEIELACSKANAHTFIDALPLKYNTQVGERGVQVSGGQKQRIAIARALIKDPAVLLLDEATSDLDTENERIVQAALEELMSGRTSIVIAHRLTTVRDANLICMIRKGEVVEQGTHDELMAKEGAYSNLVSRQATKAKTAEELEEEATYRDALAAQGDDEELALGSARRHSSFKQDDSVKEEVDPAKLKVDTKRVLALTKPTAHFSVLGVLSAMCNGALMPMFALIFSEILEVFFIKDINNAKYAAAAGTGTLPAFCANLGFSLDTCASDLAALSVKETQEGSLFWSMMFLLIAGCAGIFNFGQIYFFTRVGEHLTYTLRTMTFRSLVRQPIGWFDDDSNNTGVLTTRLATDATLVQGIAASSIGLMLQNLVCMCTGLGIAFSAGWQMTLAILACVPLIIIAGKLQMGFVMGFTKSGEKAYETAGSVAGQAIDGIRTVQSFNAENATHSLYANLLEGPAVAGIKKSHVSGFGFAFSNAVLFCVYGIAFYYGGWLISVDAPATGSCKVPGQDTWEQCTYDFNAVMRVFTGVMFSAMGVGQTSSLAPDMGAAKNATNEIFRLLDLESEIDPLAGTGEQPTSVEGRVEFCNVSFAYPTRKNIKIFDGLNLKVEPGLKVALVGDSGGGKSTVFNLLERFYNPDHGEIFFDGKEIRTLNIQWLRAQMAFVSQGPVLFATSIRANIKYGKPSATAKWRRRARLPTPTTSFRHSNTVMKPRWVSVVYK